MGLWRSDTQIMGRAASVSPGEPRLARSRVQHFRKLTKSLPCNELEARALKRGAAYSFSVELDAGAPDHIEPLGRIPADGLGKVFRCAARGLLPQGSHSLLECACSHRPVDRRVELVDYGPRHAGGSDDAV